LNRSARRWNCSQTLAEESSFPSALASLTEATRLAPGLADAHFRRGRVLQELHRDEEAKAELEAACRLDPQSADALAALGRVETDARNTGRAIELFRRVLAIRPRDPDAHYNLGKNLDQEGKRREAISHWQTAAEITPESPEPLYRLCAALKETDAQKAREYCERFQKVETKRKTINRVQAPKLAGEAAAKRGDWPGAIRSYREALDICGDCDLRALLHKYLGLWYCYAGDLKSGARELRSARALSPSDGEIQQALEAIRTLEREAKPLRP
jgi:tetratricopeptide (TPR) repeat protein